MRSRCVTVEPAEPPFAEQIHHSQSPDTSSNHSNARHKRQARKKERKKEIIRERIREQTKKNKRDREK